MIDNSRHMFLGGNTYKGFFSFYNYILSQKEANRIICIKGGPGTGKSSLMKKVGNYFNDKGYNIEYHHCSSDNNSLDGLVVKELNVAILDGTAPHVVDPINPGAVDEILYMGDCWDESIITKHREEIIDTNLQIKQLFARAYKYIGASKLIYDDWKQFNNSTINKKNLYNIQKELISSIPYKDEEGIGKERHVFATAFTPNGIITYVDTLYKNCNKVYTINGEAGTGRTELLKNIYIDALSKGHDVEVFHKPLDPEEIEHVIITDLQTAYLTSNELNKKQLPGVQIYMDNFLEKDKIIKYKNEILNDKETFYSLLNKGLDIISNAKALHDKLETYYIPSMDFDKANEKLNYVISTFEKYRE